MVNVRVTVRFSVMVTVNSFRDSISVLICAKHLKKAILCNEITHGHHFALAISTMTLHRSAVPP